MLQINCCHKKKNATSSSFSEHNYWLGCFVEKLQQTYSMKFMSLEWMLLKSGKKVRPVLKIPLNGEVKKRVQKTQRRVHVKMGWKTIRDFPIFNHFDTSTPIVQKQSTTFESRVKELKKRLTSFTPTPKYIEFLLKCSACSHISEADLCRYITLKWSVTLAHTVTHTMLWIDHDV